MSDLASSILSRAATPPPFRVGYVDSVAPLTVRVDGRPLGALQVRPILLQVEERVLVTVSGGSVWVVDTLEPKPQTGVVAAIASGLATITAGTHTYAAVPVRGTTPAVGASVLLVWGSEGVVAVGGGSTAAPALPGAIAAPVEAASTPAGEDMNRTEEAIIDARCVAARTSRGGSYRTDIGTGTIYQGRYSGGISLDNTGYFFYDDRIQSDGVCVSASIRLARPSSAGRASGVSFQLRLHDQATPGASLPTVVGAGPYARTLKWGASALFDIGTTWGQLLLDGTAKGVALVYSGTSEYGSLYGPGKSAPLAAQIIIRYRRQVS